jgi:hypothetical protein
MIAGAARRPYRAANLSRVLPQEAGMSFALFIVGLVVLVAGIAWALVMAGVATTYIAIACLVVVGIGIMSAVSRTRAKDPAT